MPGCPRSGGGPADAGLNSRHPTRSRLRQLLGLGADPWNGSGIARIDPYAGTVVTTVVPDDVVASLTVHEVSCTRSPTRRLIDAGVKPRVVRIDPEANEAVDIVAVPISGQLAILGDTAWVRNTRTGQPSRSGSTGTPNPWRAWPWIRSSARLSAANHAACGSAGLLGQIDATGRSTSIEVGDAPFCTITASGVACASERGHVVFVSADVAAVTWSNRTCLDGAATSSRSRQVANRSGSSRLRSSQVGSTPSS